MQTQDTGVEMMHMRSYAALMTGALAIAAQAQVVMDFDQYEFMDGLSHVIGTEIHEDGFTITKGPNEPNDFKVFGDMEPRYPGSAAPYNNTVDGVIYLEQDNDAPFNLDSIALAPLNSALPVAVSFTGTKEDGSEVTQTFVHSGLAIQLETFEFNDDFDDVVSVEWTQLAPFHQFDQIELVPLGGDCIADCNDDGTLNILDFVCFQEEFSDQTDAGDCDGNGEYNILDFVCFQEEFQEGCP